MTAPFHIIHPALQDGERTVTFCGLDALAPTVQVTLWVKLCTCRQCLDALAAEKKAEAAARAAKRAAS